MFSGSTVQYLGSCVLHQFGKKGGVRSQTTKGVSRGWGQGYENFEKSFECQTHGAADFFLDDQRSFAAVVAVFEGGPFLACLSLLDNNDLGGAWGSLSFEDQEGTRHARVCLGHAASAFSRCLSTIF